MVGEALISARQALVPRISPLARLAFRRIAADSDELQLEYAPAVKGDFAVALANARTRERSLRTTVIGPHRDDLRLIVNDQEAAEYTSEGQTHPGPRPETGPGGIPRRHPRCAASLVD